MPISSVIHGRTYQERKECLIQRAHEFEDLFTDGVSLTWGDLSEIGTFFLENGKRYGLLTEFRENGIL